MGFKIIYTIVDAKGTESDTSINFPTSYNFGDVRLFAEQSAARINQLITGKIVRIGIGFTVDLPSGLRAVAAANSDVEEGARFQFRTAGGYHTAMRLPTFDESYIVPGTREVDLTDADVTDFTDSMVTGAPVVALGGVLSPSDTRDDDIVELKAARESFQSSRKSS